MNKTILLTGKSGFLGTVINDYIINNLDYLVYSCSRSKDSDYVFDLSKEIPIFKDSFNIILHCAGEAHKTYSSSSNLDSKFNNNVLVTKNLLLGLQNQKMPEEFVFISSISVYGLEKGEKIKETQPLLANDWYGRSKIVSEIIVKKWCDENNVICTILRLPLVVGDNPPGNLRSMIQGIKKGYYFNIEGGGAKKSMVLASDVAIFILKASEKGGTFNLTDGNDPSFNLLSKHIAIQLGKTFVPNLPKFIAIILAKIGDLLGNKFPINSLKLAKITSTLTFDDSKARATFGWDPSPVVQVFKLKNNV